MIAEASFASVGMKRSMSEKTMASSWPGRPSLVSGEQAASKASPSSVGVVVSRSSAPTTMAANTRTG